MRGPKSLSEALGGSRELAIFEAFALRQGKQLSAADVQSMSGVAWATVHRRLTDWVGLRLLEPAGKNGKAQMYHLNNGSPSVAALVKAVQVARVELLQADLELSGVAQAHLAHPRPFGIPVSWEGPCSFGAVSLSVNGQSVPALAAP